MRFIEDEDELEAKKVALDDLVKMCETIIGKPGAEKRRKKKEESMMSIMPEKSSKALVIAESGESEDEEMSEEEMRKLKELYEKMIG